MRFSGAIWCYTYGDHLLCIFFYPRGTSLQANDTLPFTQYPGKFIGRIFTYEDRFSEFIDILRNQKPVCGRIYADTPKWNHIVISEPAGEGEV